MESEEMTYRVVIAPTANDRMAEHFEFLARVNKNAAYRLLDEFADALESLKSMPFRNPLYDRPYVPALKYRYLMSHKRYRIIYQVVDDTVFVDDIQDCRQDEDFLKR